MSDFFGGLNYSNIRFTDARINGGGPLPTSLSGPEGINGDPDGRYNFNDSLLGSIAPYAGPKDGRMGSDRNYQQIPHRKQYPVPKIYLPEPALDAVTMFDMSHPIDMGDLVFVLHMNYKHYVLTGSLGAVEDAKNNTMPNYNVFCNICTVNYILAGVTNYIMHYIILNDDEAKIVRSTHAWYKLLRCFNLDEDMETLRKRFKGTSMGVDDELEKQLHSEFLTHCKLLLQRLVRDHIRPLGICSTSEKQGGQHETGYKPVQAAASFFVTLTVDGQNRDLVNIWRGVDVEGGDLLLLQLEYKHMRKKADGPKSQSYCLNHYYKGWVQRCIQLQDRAHGVFQLVPGVLRSAFTKKVKNGEEDADAQWKKEFDKSWDKHMQQPVAQDTCSLGNTDQTINKIMLNSVWDNRQLGYWHIGQVYNKQAKFSSSVVPTDDMEMTRGQLLQINFAPVWHSSTTGNMPIVTVFFESMKTKKDAERVEYCGKLSLWALQNKIGPALLAGFMLRALEGDLDANGHISTLLKAYVKEMHPGNSHIVAKNPAHDSGLHFLPHASATLRLDDVKADHADGGTNTTRDSREHATTEQSENITASGPRFKKMRAGADVVPHAQDSSSTLVDSAAQSQPPAAQTAAVSGAKAGADGGWDFEKDLESIFAGEKQQKGKQKGKST